MATTPLMIAIHDRHAEAILDGRKTFELRRRFPAVPRGTLVYLYVTAPTAAVVGAFVVGEVHQGSPSAMWTMARAGLSLSRSEFRDYTNGARQVSIVEVLEAYRFDETEEGSRLRDIASTGTFHSPQSASYLRDQGIVGYLARAARRAAVPSERLVVQPALGSSR
jgi:predicted transcriptional regulator